MCGIFGFKKDGDFDSACRAVAGFSEIETRGPDGRGSFETSRVYLGHTRLSIQDLSQAGAQPMISSCGRYVLVYNGEIYNANELKEKFQINDDVLKGASDTEVLLNLLIRHDVQDVIGELDGMFAFALYDVAEESIVLARDKYGEKPLYYALEAGFCFGSTVGCVEALLGGKQDFNMGVIAEYLKYGCSFTNEVAFQNIFRVPVDKLVHIEVANNTAVLVDKADHLTHKHFDPKQRFNEYFDKICGSRLIGDVSCGVFLSSGLDSSLVAAHLATQRDSLLSQGKHHPTAYTFDYSNANSTELAGAQLICQILDLKNIAVAIKSEDLQSICDELTQIIDEPISDVSLPGLVALSKEASKDFKVVLTGDGGDEQFFGYKRIIYAYYLERLLSPIMLLLPRKLKLRFYNNLVDAVYSRLGAARYMRPSWRVLAKSRLTNIVESQVCESLVEIFHRLDLFNYFPNKLAIKSDRVSMAFGLELRTPYLSRFFEAKKINPNTIENYISAGKGKMKLRKIADDIFPAEISRAKKKGFTPPVESWLAVELFDWAYHSLCNPNRILVESVDFEKAKADLRKMKEGSGSHYIALWTLISINNWLNFKNSEFSKEEEFSA